MMVSKRVISPIIVISKKFYSYSTVADSKEKTIRIAGCDTNYLKVGHGPHHVLCLPGTLGSIWTDFRLQVEQFDRTKFTVVVWEPPGFGRSRPPLRNFNMDMYETDAIHALQLMKALHVPKYSILGWSGGGISGLIHAAMAPEATHKLVVWATASFIFPHELQWYRNIRDISTWSEQMRKPFLDVYGKQLLVTYWSQWVDTMADIYTKRKGEMCRNFLKHVKCPTFVLHGARDTIADPVHSSILKENIRDARLYTYPRGKHNIHLRYGYDFNKRVQDFLMEDA